MLSSAGALLMSLPLLLSFFTFHAVAAGIPSIFKDYLLIYHVVIIGIFKCCNISILIARHPILLYLRNQFAEVGKTLFAYIKSGTAIAFCGN
jgi:hypothetical protein